MKLRIMPGLIYVKCRLVTLSDKDLFIEKTLKLFSAIPTDLLRLKFWFEWLDLLITTNYSFKPKFVKV